MRTVIVPTVPMTTGASVPPLIFKFFFYIYFKNVWTEFRR